MSIAIYQSISNVWWVNRMTLTPSTRPGTPEIGGNEGGLAFFITLSYVISWFIKIELKQIYCSYSCTHKIQNGFI